MIRRPFVASARRLPRRLALGPLAAVLAVAWLAPAVAAANEVPAGANFDIWYYTTDRDGDRDRLFSETDLTSFVNQARCQCNHTISTRVLLQRAMTFYDPTVRVETFIGNRCDVAQSTVNPQITPCVRVLSEAPNAYTKAINFEFSPIWLVGGVEPSGPQTLGQATPTGSCEIGQGDAGIWICIENGAQPECQPEEFQVTGTQNMNATGGTDGGGGGVGLRYDFDPPQTLPSNFTTDSGDGSVIIKWEQIATGDVSGFRVLCADEDGNPLPGKGIDPPSLTGINRGTIYFTQQNLCPEGPFDGGEDPDVGTTGDEATGDSGSSSSGDSSGSSGDSSSSSGDTGSSSGTGDTGTTPLPSDGIASLNWDYICSPHFSGTSQEARVSGLNNGEEYQFLIVAYDIAGNPVAASDVLVASPRETIDLWEQCEIDGDICGSGGFCNCTADARPTDGAWWLLAPLLGLGRRRRRRA